MESEVRNLWESFAASAAEMEGAAIAQTASYTGVQFAVLRVISDQAYGKSSQAFEVIEEETGSCPLLL